jgi:Glycosyltransferase family 87
MTQPLAANRRVTLALTVVFLAVGLAEILATPYTGKRDPTCDICRQWVVTQYALRRVNPYPVALDALRAHYGVLAPRGPVHLKDVGVFAIPKSGPNAETDPNLGPPESTYPPPSLTLLLPIGYIPRDAVRVLWAILNAGLLLVVARELQLLSARHGIDAPFLFFAGVAAIWPVTAYCFEVGQFSLLALACILVARRLEPTHAIAAGLIYSLALVKPSLSLPFLFLPLFDKRVKTLTTLALSQLALFGAMSWLVHASPIAMTRDWLSVAAYFRAGMYTVQEIINRLRIDGSIWDMLLEGGILLAGAALAFRLAPPKRIAVLAVVSCIWTYHSQYDFVVLLIPAALLAVSPMDRRWAFNVCALILIGIGLTVPVYFGEAMLERAVRQLARVSFPALLVGIVMAAAPVRRREHAARTANP